MITTAGEATICLATVISIVEHWLLIRLDGCDNSNDRWIMCDDPGLHPVCFIDFLTISDFF